MKLLQALKQDNVVSLLEMMVEKSGSLFSHSITIY